MNRCIATVCKGLSQYNNVRKRVVSDSHLLIVTASSFLAVSVVSAMELYRHLLVELGEVSTDFVGCRADHFSEAKHVVTELGKTKKDVDSEGYRKSVEEFKLKELKQLCEQVDFAPNRDAEIESTLGMDLFQTYLGQPCFDDVKFAFQLLDPQKLYPLLFDCKLSSYPLSFEEFLAVDDRLFFKDVESSQFSIFPQGDQFRVVTSFEEISASQSNIYINRVSFLWDQYTKDVCFFIYYSMAACWALRAYLKYQDFYKWAGVSSPTAEVCCFLSKGRVVSLDVDEMFLCNDNNVKVHGLLAQESGAGLVLDRENRSGVTETSESTEQHDKKYVKVSEPKENKRTIQKHSRSGMERQSRRWGTSKKIVEKRTGSFVKDEGSDCYIRQFQADAKKEDYLTSVFCDQRRNMVVLLKVKQDDWNKYYHNLLFNIQRFALKFNSPGLKYENLGDLGKWFVVKMKARNYDSLRVIGAAIKHECFESESGQTFMVVELRELPHPIQKKLAKLH